ncbi:MAG TPA: hypothetical protein VFU26_07960 [Gaiellaceae bacterium]|nr:hypothetical protein [Gaiellaceae bacterium]
MGLPEALVDLQELRRSLATPTTGGHAGFPRVAVSFNVGDRAHT